MRRAGVAVGIAVLLVVPGCGTPRARVHGTVKYQGKPLGGALITFYSADNATFSAPTRPDGTYQVTGVPQGTVRVSVQISGPGPLFGQKARRDYIKEGDPKPGKKNWEEKRKRVNKSAAPSPRIILPARYGNPDTSELSFELKELDQDYSIDLK
jgi:hypothetical protein